MNITTKGHIENINNDKITTNSWDGRWNESQGNGSIATINTNKKGNEPVNVIEDYKPITNAEELKPYMDPRMDMYFALRTKPRVETDPAFQIHDDLKEGALVNKLEHLLQRNPKVIVFKPQKYEAVNPSSSMSRSRSPSSMSRSPSNRSRSPSNRSRNRSRSSSMSTSTSRSRTRSSKSNSLGKPKQKKQIKSYATPKRKTNRVQTRKKKTPTPKKKKTPTPKKKKTPTPKKKKTPTPKKKKTSENEIGGFTPPRINFKDAVKAITPKIS